VGAPRYPVEGVSNGERIGPTSNDPPHLPIPLEHYYYYYYYYYSSLHAAGGEHSRIVDGGSVVMM